MYFNKESHFKNLAHFQQYFIAPYTFLYIVTQMGWLLINSNVMSFFRFVNKQTIYRLGIISLAHA